MIWCILKHPTSNLDLYYETSVHFEAIHEKNVKFFCLRTYNEVLKNYVENFADFFKTAAAAAENSHI
jgi:hypothetical protein